MEGGGWGEPALLLPVVLPFGCLVTPQIVPRLVNLTLSSTHFTSLPSRCRKADAAVEMDEMVAAMVLTSLSCSPVVQSPPASESGIPCECAFKIFLYIC